MLIKATTPLSVSPLPNALVAFAGGVAQWQRINPETSGQIKDIQHHLKGGILPRVLTTGVNRTQAHLHHGRPNQLLIGHSDCRIVVHIGTKSGEPSIWYLRRIKDPKTRKEARFNVFNHRFYYKYLRPYLPRAKATLSQVVQQLHALLPKVDS